MGKVAVNGRNGTDVVDAQQMMGMFLGEAAQDALRFQERLREDPMALEEVEREVQALFNRGAGLYLSGLIAKTMQEASFQQSAEQLRDQYEVDLKNGSDRQIQMRLGGGFACFATTHYCPPKRQGNDDRSIPGLDIELSQFGFSGGDSPGLVSKVARRVWHCRHGVPLAVPVQTKVVIPTNKKSSQYNGLMRIAVEVMQVREVRSKTTGNAIWRQRSVLVDFAD